MFVLRKGLNRQHVGAIVAVCAVSDIGAMTASLAWFAGLGFGARFLLPLFVKPMATRILDALIAVVMAGIAVSLFTQGVHA